MQLRTVGHGTLDAGAFVALLHDHGVSEIVDVRRFPGSRRHPHVAREAMTGWLAAAGIAYRWSEALGGRRSVPADSPDVALRTAAFRGYAAHMRTEEFRAAFDAVRCEAGGRSVALMCAESVWWRCHRRMIADAAVLLHGLDVGHLMHDGRVLAHEVTAGARVTAQGVVYDVGVTPPLPGSA